MSVNIVECHGDLPDGVVFNNGIAAVDTETLGLNIKRDRLCLVQVGDGEGNVWLIKFDGTNYDTPNLKALLQNPKILKIFHYGRFDIAVMKHYLGVMTEKVYCTKIASKLVRTYTDRHGLKALVGQIVGTNMDKGEQCSDWSAPELTESQKHYAASDVIYLHQLKGYFDEKLKELDRVELADASFNYLPVRAQLDLGGWEEADIFSHR